MKQYLKQLSASEFMFLYIFYTDPKKEFDVHELIKLTDYKDKHIYMLLSRLIKNNHIERVSHGYYQLKNNIEVLNNAN